MIKTLLLFFLFSVITVTSAQVVANFDNAGELSGFSVKTIGEGGGSALDSVYQANDPTKKSAGIMILHLNFTKADSGICSLSNKILTKNTQLITFWVYLPSNENIPDSLKISLFAADEINMQTVETGSYVKDIPKNTWYPLSLPIVQLYKKNPLFNIGNGQLSQIGLKIFNSIVPNISWSGNIYVDNVSQIGAEPKLYTDFKTGVSGFTIQWSNGWVDSVKQISGPVGDSTGVLRFYLADGSSKTGGAAAGIEPANGYSAKDYNMLAFWVYVDTSFPDSAYLQPFAQDNSSWAWPSPSGINTYFGKDIPKDVWYPVYFDLSQATISDKNTAGGSFDHLTYPLGKFGLQVDGPASWNGSVYIDNVQFLNSTVTLPSNWAAADFETSANNLQGFYIPDIYTNGYVSRILDTKTSDKTYVMKADVAFSGSQNQFAVQNDNIPALLDSKDPNKYSTQATFEIYLPDNMPFGASVNFIISGNSTNSQKVESSYMVDSAGLMTGMWNSLQLNLDSLIQTGAVNPSKTSQIEVEIKYSGDTTVWSGSIYFDNLTFDGIQKSGQLVTQVAAGPAEIKTFKLYNNYPNPFNPSTKIKYDIPKASNVVVKVYDVLGREVETLVNARQNAGSYSLNFDGSNLASGMYIYRITAGGFIQSRKMILLK